MYTVRPRASTTTMPRPATDAVWNSVPGLDVDPVVAPEDDELELVLLHAASAPPPASARAIAPNRRASGRVRVDRCSTVSASWSGVWS
jgi:hypothetical protein